MHTQHAKALLVLLSAALALLLPPAQAQTIRTAEAYQTDFDDAVSADFCGGAAMEFRYNPMPGGEGHTAHATNSFHSGYARLSERYSNHVLLSLVAGGAQSPTLVNVGNVPDGSGGKTNIYGYAAGIFSNATVRMTYTLYTASGTMSHTNLTVYLAGRKNDIPASAANVGPSPYRVPHYLAWYNGRRLSVGEWTYLGGAAPREIAGANVATGSHASTFVLVLSFQGGDDAGGVAANGNPCELRAELWENGTRLAWVQGQDNPYNWTTGPEVANSVFAPTGDYGNGAWNPYAGDWDDYQSWGRGNHDIRLPGWIVFGFKPVISIGTFQGIDVQTLSVTQPAEIQDTTLIIVR